MVKAQSTAWRVAEDDRRWRRELVAQTVGQETEVDDQRGHLVISVDGRR